MSDAADCSPVLLATAARRNAAQYGDAPAVIDGSTTWTWHDLDSIADAVAAELYAAGVQPHDRIALLARSNAAAIAFLHGAARARVVVFPLNERLSAAELSAFLAELDVKLVVAAGELVTTAKRFGPSLLVLDELLARSETAPEQAALAVADDPAVIVATSGTTGRPKGALLTHGQMAASAAAWNAFLPAATGWLASLSLAHVGGLGIVWRAALASVPVVVAPGNDTGLLLPAVGMQPVSHVSVVAVQLVRLLDAAGGAPPPSRLRAVLLGGGPIPPDLVTRALASGWPVVPTYGMTESASGVTALRTAEAAARPDSAGRALPGAELRVVRPSSDGIGEIEVRGPSLFDGYVGRGAGTAAAFTPDGWYQTGDLGHLDDDGYLAVADRRLDLIVSGGENVYPAEVEAVLAKHPAIADAGVAGRPDATWGAVPVAVVVLHPNVNATDEEILSHCRHRLAGFKVPALIVRVAELPRVGPGKLNRQALRELVAEACPGSANASVAPSIPPLRHLVRSDGHSLAYRVLDNPTVGMRPGRTRPTVLLLHSTLSSGWQLKQLARTVAGWAIVLLPDRRGSGASQLAVPRPVGLEEQVADVVALLDELGVGRVTVFGHSFGAIVALALAAAHPGRVETVMAYEPPLFGAVATAELARPSELAGLVVAAYADGGAAAAARAFLHAIGGEEALERASASTRAAILGEGDGVLADIGSIDANSLDLSRVVCPVLLVTGDASQPFYGPIADAAAASLPRACRVRLPGLGHAAPITQPTAIAELLHQTLLGD